MHFRSKFGDSSLNGWWVMVWKSSKWGKFDFEDQGRSSPKTIGTQTKVFCISGPNLVILAWMGDELSSGQARDCYTHTHGHTYPQTQAMTIPEGQNWPRVKSGICTKRCLVESLLSFDFSHVCQHYPTCMRTTLLMIRPGESMTK